MRQHTTLLALVLLATACRDSPTRVDASHQRELRVVSLHDTTTELLVGVGAVGYLVAIVEPADLAPETALAVRSIPRLPRGPLSCEGLIGLRPTHVFGTDASLERQPELGLILEQSQIASVFLDPVNLDALWLSIAKTGVLLGFESEAQQWTASLKAEIAAFARPAPSSPAAAIQEPVSVFIYDCCDPPFTGGGKIPLNELLNVLGARNVFDELKQDWGRVSWEAVLMHDPELIIVNEYDHVGQSSSDGKLRRLKDSVFMGQVNAVRDDSFIVLPLALALEGPRCVEALSILEPAIERARQERRKRQPR